MVLYALMLHSHAFLEDCLRSGKMPIWNNGLPLDFVDRCINHQNFIYDPGVATRQNWTRRTGLAWENLDDPEYKSIECFRCQQEIQVPWTTRRETGYADQSFLQQCPVCNFSITRQAIYVQEFRKDLQALLEGNIPLRGTYLSTHGVPMNTDVRFGSAGTREAYARMEFPNNLFRNCLASILLEEVRPSHLFPGMDNIFKAIATALRDKSIIRCIQEITGLKSISHIEIVSLHHVLSKYNLGCPFMDNFHTTVIQLSMVLDNIEPLNWFQFPDLLLTRLKSGTDRYKSFLIQKHKGKETSTSSSRGSLDLVFLWNTHKTIPRWYYDFSLLLTGGTLVDNNESNKKNHDTIHCPLCGVILPPFPPLKWMVVQYLNCINAAQL